jgi:hypothetical protein
MNPTTTNTAIITNATNPSANQHALPPAKAETGQKRACCRVRGSGGAQRREKQVTGGGRGLRRRR